MRRKKVIINYSGLKMDELHTLGGKVVDSLRENAALYPNLPLDLVDLEALTADFQQKWQVAKNGGSRLDRSYRDEARDALLAAFGKLSSYVNYTAAGNESMLISSGFILESAQSASRKGDIPLLVELVDGPQKNQLELRFQKVKNAWSYEYQYAHAVDGEGEPLWGELLDTSKTRYNIIAPTVPGTTYFARVRARNRKGPGDWSATVSLMAR